MTLPFPFSLSPFPSLTSGPRSFLLLSSLSGRRWAFPPRRSLFPFSLCDLEIELNCDATYTPECEINKANPWPSRLAGPFFPFPCHLSPITLSPFLALLRYLLISLFLNRSEIKCNPRAPTPLVGHFLTPLFSDPGILLFLYYLSNTIVNFRGRFQRLQSHAHTSDVSSTVGLPFARPGTP